MNLPHPLILASNSPRRQELLKEAGFTFQVVARPINESHPDNLEPAEVALHIAKKKLKAYSDLVENNIILCADTIVVQDRNILGKPKDEAEAFNMLKTLNNNSHEVITAVAISAPGRERAFTERTKVVFESLNDEEILHYVKKFKPLDKAGAYGIQEWIGLIGIKEIHGSYYNVVGLPLHRVYNELKSHFT